jgi:hypothetical protein
VNILGIAVSIAVVGALSVGGFKAFSAVENYKLNEQSITMIKNVSESMREYDAHSCMAIGYSPTGGSAAACTASNWPTNFQELVSAGFFPAKLVAGGNLLQNKNAPINILSIGGQSGYEGLIVVSTPASECQALQSVFQASCGNGKAYITVPREQTGAWGLVNSGNFSPP